MQADEFRRAADSLVQARATGQPMEGLPEDLRPTDVSSAYAIQDLVTMALGPVGAWKTAAARAGVKFNWAPIPAAGVHRHGAELALADLPGCELELEVGLTVKHDLPPRTAPYSRQEVVDALGELCVCLELFSSRYLDRTARSAMEILADAQNALGVVIGTGLHDWSGIDLSSIDLILDYAGRTHTSSGGRTLNDVLDACTDLANATGRLGGLQAGQVIITGARIGPLPLSDRGEVLGKIPLVGTVQMTLS